MRKSRLVVNNENGRLLSIVAGLIAGLYCEAELATKRSPASFV
jgi:hypothetical protein